MLIFYAWLMLIGAGISEVIWAYFMKKCDGFKNLIPSILFVLFNIISTVLLAFAVKYLPISTAYPIWVGIGAVGTVIAGIFFFAEKTSFLKVFFLLIILIGIIGIKLF